MLGARLAMLRKSKKLSQAELAALLGVSASAVGMYEQGRREPDCALLVRMAEIFSVSCDFLLTGAAGAREAPILRQQWNAALASLDGALVLECADGSRRAFSEEDAALLFSAMLG